MFNKIKVFFSFVILTILGLFSFVSCEVGLGSAVDTEKPTVAITYPTGNPVIKDYFVIAGTCDDDKQVNSVKITISKIENNQSKEINSFVVTPKDKFWQAEINKKDEQGLYPLIDGTYKIDVQSIDAEKKYSDPQSITFDIDNTTPVFIIKNPGITDIENASPFGSVFKVVGSVADDHDISKMIVTVMDKDKNILDTWQEENIDTAGGVEVIFARFNSEAASDTDIYNTRYSKVYGENAKGDKFFYCTVDIEDSATVWQNPKIALPSEQGNSTQALYLYDNVYNDLMSKNSIYQLTASDFKMIENGTYSKSIPENFNTYKTDTNTTPLAFMLNKDANPTYSITGFAFEKIENQENSTSITENKAAKRGKVTFRAISGLDGTFIDPKTIKIYLFGPYNQTEVSKELLDLIYDNPSSYYEKQRECAITLLGNGGGSPSEEEITAKSKVRILKDLSTYKGQTVSDYSDSVVLPDSVTKGAYYIFAASGIDVDGLSLINDGYYGFTGESAGFPPSALITYPEDSALFNIVPQITGTISSDESNINRVEYEVLVKDEANNSTTVGTLKGNAKANDGEFNSFTEEYVIDLSLATQTVKAPYTSCLPKENEECMYKYDLIIKGYDETGLHGAVSRSFRVDKKKPEIKINSVNKVADTKDGINIVNGKIEISANITDANFKNATLTIFDNNENSEEYIFNTSYFVQTVDTRSFTDNEILNISIKAEDNAGNKNELLNTSYKINQDSDKPVITSSNAKDKNELADKWNNIKNGQNLFGVKTNNTVSFTITDDDGIERIIVDLYKSDEETKKVPTMEYNANGVTSYTVSYKLPSDFEDYKIKITALDTEFNTSTFNEYFVSVNESSLNLRFVDINNDNSELNIKANTQTSVKGTVGVSQEQIKSIKKYELVYDTEEAVYKIQENSVPVSKYEQNALNNTITVSTQNGITTWIDNYEGSLLSSGDSLGAKHFAYVVEDKFSNTEQKDLKINIDNKVPFIGFTNNANNTEWKNSTVQNIVVVASDIEGAFNSGIDVVQCKIVGSDIIYDLAADKKCDRNGVVSDSGKYRIYKTTLDIPEGTQTVKVWALDNVANKSSELSITLNIDTTIPVLDLQITNGQVLNNSKSLKVYYNIKDYIDEPKAYLASGINKLKIGFKQNLSDCVEFDLEGIKASTEGDYKDLALSSLTDGDYKVYIQTEDMAGNKTQVIESVNSFTVDSTSPVVKITSPVASTQIRKTVVNKVISLSGTVVDSNISETLPSVSYFSNDTWNKINIEQTDFELDGQNWTINNIDTSLINNTTTAKDVYFKVLFTDKAGNTTADYKTYFLNIDQKTDKPEIKLNSINITSSVISSNKVSGVITDDDGDVLHFYKIDKSVYEANPILPNKANHKWQEVSVESGTGLFNITLPNTESEGIKNWYFAIVDKNNTLFSTVSNSLLSRIYLTDANNTKTDNTTGIEFSYDITAPQIEIKTAHGTLTSLNELVGWEDSNNIYGGNSYLWVKAIVQEDVGMHQTTPISLTIKGKEIAVSSVNHTNGTNIYEYIFSPINIAEKINNTESYPEGNLQLVVTAKDSSELENKNMQNITVDKTGPTVKIITPQPTVQDAVSSAISIKGIIQDNYSNIERLQYAIPKANGTESEWKDIATSASWEILFASGAPDSSDSLLYFANAKDDENNFIYDVVAEGTENIYKVPIHFKALDSAGNESITSSLYVLVDSDGGKPKAWITSPEDGSTTSGIVTIYGGANDNVSVKTVCLQLDANCDGIFDSNDYDLINGSTWDDSFAKANLKGTSDNWYIEASGTNSWKVDIDSDKLISSSTNKVLSVRVKAIDSDDQSRDYTQPISINIDSETPVIKNLKLVQYGKNITPNAQSVPVSEREYIAGMYISNVSVEQNGSWYLVGQISDNQSVSSVNFEKITSTTLNNIDLGLSTITVNNASYNLCVPLKTDVTGVINYIVKANDANNGVATANIIINIDSTAPSLYTTSNFESVNVGSSLRLKSVGKILGTNKQNSTIVNNNNYFTFGDVVSESGSGLEYLAFYFERDGSSEKRIYNPMFADLNKTVINEKPITPQNGNVYINEDGLACMYVNVSSRTSEDSIQVSDINPNIRKGGLIKIAGGYSRITEVNGNTIKFSPTASIQFTEAEIIYAQIVDHQIVETFAEDNKTVINDDEDGMVESITMIGSSYNWNASIDSTNIPDGPIYICVTAIDKAGNVSKGKILTRVENNRPRIAKVLLATDLNDNGKFDWNAESAPVNTGDAEKDTKDGKAYEEFSYYSGLNKNTGKAQYEVKLDSSSFKVINKLCIIPEFIGGNNGVGYILENPTNLDSATKSTGTVTEMTTKENLLSQINSSGSHSISNEISNFGGIVLDAPQNNISITFWDKTEETVQGQSSQWALLKLPVQIMSSETEKPKSNITPFYWNNNLDNSVYSQNNILQGHIELESDLPEDEFTTLNGLYDKNPKVSGKIKIEGYVEDNVRLKSINLAIDGIISDTQIATYNKGTWVVNTSLNSEIIIDCQIDNIYISQEGHKAKYTIVVDTEKVSGIAALDKVIKVSSTDWKDNTSLNATYTIDIVPYITCVWTKLSEYNRAEPSLYARSSLGNYVVAENDQIKLYGWNLNSSTSVLLNDIAISSVSVANITNENASGTKEVSFTIPEQSNSGLLKVIVNNVEALNNKNNNDAIGTYSGLLSDKDATGKEYANGYNRQPNGINNNLLTDDLNIDVWNFKVAASPEGSSAKYVHMKVGPYLEGNINSGRIGFSFKNGIGYFNMPGKGRNVTSTGTIKLRIPSSFNEYTHMHVWYTGFQTTWPGYNIKNDFKLASDGYYEKEFSTSSLSYKFNNSGNNEGQNKTEVISSGVWTYSNSSFTRTGDIEVSINNLADYVFSQTRMGTNFGGFTSNAFTFDKNGNTYGVAMCPDTSGTAGMAANLQFFSRETGSNNTENSVDLNFNYKNVLNARRIENICYYKDGSLKTDEERIQVPSMASYVKDDISYIYVAYYDHGLDQIKFRLGSVGTGANDIGLGLVDLKGATAMVSGVGDSGKIGYGNDPVFDSTDSRYAGYKYVSVISEGSNASADVAVAALSDGTAVVAYYNGSNLLIKTADFTLLSTGSAVWSTPKVVSSIGGKNVALVVDQDNGLHFAYSSNSGSDLYYTYLENINASSHTVLVDSYDNVGSYCTIDVARNDNLSPWVPVITYKRDASSVSTKIAKPVVFNEGKAKEGALSSGLFTGNWDICTIPSNNNSISDLINVGLCKDWDTGIIKEFVTGTDDNSYNPGGTYNICNSSIIYGNGTINPVVGYAVESGFIEVAQKR